MDLFIQIRDGKPYEHPIMGENFRQAFPHIDTNNLPPEFALFERVPCPYKAGFYEVDVVSYEWVDGIVRDVWTVRPMTPEEKSEKIAEYTEGLNRHLTNLKNDAQNFIDKAETDEVKEAWQKYISELDSFTYDDISQVKLPTRPRVDKNGNVITTTSSGSTPNVTG